MLECRIWLMTVLTFLVMIGNSTLTQAGSKPSPELALHLTGIANLARPSPMVTVPAGTFFYGSKHVSTSPYGNWTPFDDTELPQHQVWLDTYEIDRDEVSLGEYLIFLHQRNHHPSDELQKLLWHVITIHSIPDETLARWPVLYVTWTEAKEFCAARNARLPTEAEWEKAARGAEGYLFPWGETTPGSSLAMFGQHHVHEIPILAAVDSLDQGKSPYGLHHMAGNVAEWVQDWFGPDYYAYMPERNPPGPATGRYKGVRGGSWKSARIMLRTATRGGASPDQRSATIGFRCTRPSIKSAN
ncbi:MAG: SUMF1/EgtB/PvdO family nonheme iron enzyme [Nitrospira sp.]|nr:SUMF1/EgtB/PvdO family nonheme iron enzyme [Nitrospira sp.]MBS0152976.1 SUMF1/EgtB/PvdO family nonheme iron enzyme [Nitrospira sp.]MBS0167315.1 SUMF1/EgtB/PvdO family nonheme iron enzyme [Nitrospira sp.]